MSDDELIPLSRLPQRFWDKVNRTSTCWLWTGYTDPFGYGHYSVNRKRSGLMANRVLWEAIYGLLLPGMCVLHKCDTPACVRPSHLFIGTRDDNNRDMRNKRRHMHGETHTTAKLTEAQILEILRLYSTGISQAEISLRYGIAASNVSVIVRARTWKHLAQPPPEP